MISNEYNRIRELERNHACDDCHRFKDQLQFRCASTKRSTKKEDVYYVDNERDISNNNIYDSDFSIMRLVVVINVICYC